MNINTRKLNRLVARGEDLVALRDGAQRSHQDLIARAKAMRGRMTDNASTQGYRTHVAALSIDKLLALTPEQQAGFRIPMDDVHDLVDTLARCEKAKVKAAEASAESNTFNQFVRSLQEYAATQQGAKA